ncbi:unnamed protein product [Rhizophagus irregularis]|nr:unnamed protein product [Rhizophagus irregularis]
MILDSSHWDQDFQPEATHKPSYIVTIGSIICIYPTLIRILRWDRRRSAYEFALTLGGARSALDGVWENAKRAIRPRPEQFCLQAKHVFESRVVLLIRIAQRRDCALKLMESGVLSTWMKLTFLDERPKFNKTANGKF